MKSPTVQSLKRMRDAGYACEVTERWNPFAKCRQDMFGFVDIICCGPEDTIAVQTTVRGEVKRRIAKIQGLPQAKRWLSVNAKRRIQVHGWAKMGERGQRKTWICLCIEMKTKPKEPR